MKIRCAECGMSGEKGRTHYPGNDPENGPAHKVVSMTQIVNNYKNYINKISKMDPDLLPRQVKALAADIFAASLYSGVPKKQAQNLIRVLSEKTGMSYSKVLKQASSDVYGSY